VVSVPLPPAQPPNKSNKVSRLSCTAHPEGKEADLAIPLMIHSPASGTHAGQRPERPDAIRGSVTSESPLVSAAVS
jgi:hypothetical protein